MTPFEKAKELYDRYEFVYIPNYTSKHEVKQCALIAVDYLINENSEIEELVGQGFNLEFWEFVKIEIARL